MSAAAGHGRQEGGVAGGRGAAGFAAGRQGLKWRQQLALWMAAPALLHSPNVGRLQNSVAAGLQARTAAGGGSKT